MTPEEAHRAIGLVDLTNLEDDCDADAVDALCARAIEYGTAAVCVWPDFVARASDRVDESPVRVATVVNFPTGDERVFAVEVLSDRALDDGADEIDLVLPYRAFAAGDSQHARSMVASIREQTRGRAVLKVILETGELVDPALIRAASDLAIEAGADFVKTSTGKSPTSATTEAAAVMLDAIAASGRRVGLKPSGGIRTAEDAEQYLALAEARLGVDAVTPERFRFGASGLLTALVTVAAGSPGAPGSDASSY